MASRTAIVRNTMLSGQVDHAVASRTRLPFREDALLKSRNTLHHPQGGVSNRPGLDLSLLNGESTGLNLPAGGRLNLDVEPHSGDRVPMAQNVRLIPWYKSETERWLILLQNVNMVAGPSNFPSNTYLGTGYIVWRAEVADDGTLSSWQRNTDAAETAVAFGSLRRFRAFTGNDYRWWETINYLTYADSLIITSERFPPLRIHALPEPGSRDSVKGGWMKIYNPPLRKVASRSAALAEGVEEYRYIAVGTNHVVVFGPMLESVPRTGSGDPNADRYVPVLSTETATDDRLKIPTGHYVMQWGGYVNSRGNAIGDWPSTVALHHSRLVLGGTREEPATLWFSQVGDATNFIAETLQPDDFDDRTPDETETRSDYATKRTLNAHNRIYDTFSDTDLIVLTTGGEWTVSGAVDATDLTTATARQYSHLGTKLRNGVAAIDGQVFFASSESAQALVYNSTFRGYEPRNITAARDTRLFAGEMKRAVHLQATQAHGYNGGYLVPYLRRDGTIAVYHTLLEHEFAAWSEWDFENLNVEAKDIAAVDNHLFILAEDEDGRRHVGRLDFTASSDTEPTPDGFLVPFTVEIETVGLASQYVPEFGNISLKRCRDVHVLADQATGLQIAVGTDEEYSTFDEFVGSAASKGVRYGTRRHRPGNASLEIVYDSNNPDYTIRLRQRSGQPLRLLRIDAIVEFDVPSL